MALPFHFKKILSLGLRTFSSCFHLNDPYIISAVRTPIGSFHGKLSSLNAIQLGSIALSKAVEASQIPKNDIQELVLGCTFQSGLGPGPDRQISTFSGLPSSIISSTVNKLCGSGMKAIMIASQIIWSNSQEVVAAGGVESLSNVPFFVSRKNPRLGHGCLHDIILHDGINDFLERIDVSYYADEMAREYSITRQEQDEYGLQSFNKAIAAGQNGYFSDELVPISLKGKGVEGEIISEDEEPKNLDAEKYCTMAPVFGKDGTITAGNASGLGDGACIMILASGNYVLKKNLTPLARVVSFADGAVEAKNFCIAPAIAIPRALVKANLTADDISLWEIHETFSLTPIINLRLLRIDPDRVNVHGGAVAMGHPFGMSGARIVTHLAHTLPKGCFGCASISHAGGGASALIIEKI